MSKRSLENFAYFIKLLPAGLNPYHIANDYWKLLAISKSMTRIDTANCNGLYQNEMVYLKRITKQIENARAIVKPLGLGFYHQSDPRGVALYVGKVDELDENNYDMAGLPIY